MGLGDTGSSAVRPLTKQRRDTQQLYQRRAEVERQLAHVHGLTSLQILERLQTNRRDREDYLFDETIVYLLREKKAGGNETEIETLYPVLNARLWRLLSRFRGRFGEQADFEDFGQKVEMSIIRKILDLRSDLADYAQVNFGDFAVTEALGVWRGLVSLLKKDAQYLSIPRAGEDEGSDPISKIDSAETTVLERMVIGEAIRKLPPHLQTVGVLLADGWKIESGDPAEPTISRYMGVSSRTIRNWVNEARRILDEYKGELR